MARLSVVPAWRLEGGVSAPPHPVDARVLPLLRAIRRLGSLSAAARDERVPYRTAWAVLEATERALGTTLARLERGRGAKLTAFAERWLAQDDLAGAAVASQAEPIALEVSRAASVLRVAASHDIALAQLRDRWRTQHGVALSFHGSAESLDLYLTGAADIAGFHYAIVSPDASEPLLARLVPERDALLRFIVRSQGLIVPRGNPHRVRTLRDVADRSLSIVNRQPGSGTRLLLDRLLAAERIVPAALRGYADEEFTHAAVAATVAAGKADVAFGIEAAASQFGLSFVPLVRERYRFACPRRALDSVPVAAFRALLASPATRAVVKPLPGYRLDAPGKTAGPE